MRNFCPSEVGCPAYALAASARSACLAVLAPASRPSAVEYRPADVVSQPLIVQDKIANRIRQLVALPAALEPAGTLALAFRRSRTRGLDRVGCGAELVRSDVRDHRRLTGSIRGMARRASKIPGRPHRMPRTLRGSGTSRSPRTMTPKLRGAVAPVL